MSHELCRARGTPVQKCYGEQNPKVQTLARIAWTADQVTVAEEGFEIAQTLASWKS